LSDFAFSFDILLNMSETDLQLITRYASQRAEAAFAEIVRRHIDLVHSAALRQVRSRELAEEVAQAVFLELARQAHHLPPRTVLAAWLYHVTRRRAIDVVRREAGRRLREQTAQELQAMNATAEDWTHIEPLLDDAMDALEETDRLAVLLRYFQNKPLHEVGQAMGVTDDAAQKRVRRAVERLREFFAKRGVTVGTSGLVVVISANAVQAAPVGLVLTISTAAAAIAGTTFATSVTTIAMISLKKTLIMAGLIGGGFLASFVIQQRVNSGLRAELATLRGKMSNNTNASMTNLQTSAAEETERAHREHRELLRLRGQNALLRSEMRKYAARDGNGNRAVATKEATAVAAENTPLVSAAFVARVPTGQTLISGGWVNEPGKRIFMLSTPASTPNADNEGSIDIPTQLIEVSEATWNQLGWEQLRSDPQHEMQGLLDASQTAQLLKTLNEIGEVTVRSSPRITIPNGQEAEIIIGETPDDLRIGMLPTQTADKSAFDLSLRLHMSRSSTNAHAKEN
jgi:RNA polymerase sigma factor (sigma-70 family)